VFALPFAFIGMLLGAGGLPSLFQLVWITVAMVGARTAAMSFNRIADRSYDARNPRTSSRPLPSGRMGTGWAFALMAGSCAVFLVACWALGPLCLALSPIALGIVLSYSYTKRFTWLTHLYLGLSLAIAPVGAWIAVSGPLSPVPVLLAFAVLCWTAGFDLIYSCQDAGFDRAHRLQSIPVRFGAAAALRLSAALHALMVLALIGVAITAHLATFYLIGVALTAGVLIYEHRIVRPDDLSRVNVAFFTLNGWVAVILLLATLLDLVA
jgi:4-hydroxybenzoate polyprenyltransferase